MKAFGCILLLCSGFFTGEKLMKPYWNHYYTIQESIQMFHRIVSRIQNEKIVLPTLLKESSEHCFYWKNFFLNCMIPWKTEMTTNYTN